MRCVRCNREDADCLALFLTPEAEAMARALPDCSQQGLWCPRCRLEAAAMLERIQRYKANELRQFCKFEKKGTL